MKNRKLLIVEDDQNFGSVLKNYLSLHDFDVTLAKNGIEGLEKFKKEAYDLCLLDVMMPYKDGFRLASEIRNKMKSKVPIIFLTAKSMKEDVLKGYKIGADDYLTKPFDSEILIFKIKSLLNRNLPHKVENKEKELRIGDYIFDPKFRQLVYKKEVPSKLSPKESKLLALLLHYKNSLMSREEALTKIWNEDNYFTSRSMDVYIAKLRKRFSKDERVKIINIHSEGFRLIVE